METFLRTTNHDLRTALNAIVVSTAILSESKDNFNESQLECLEMLEAGSEASSCLLFLFFVLLDWMLLLLLSLCMQLCNCTIVRMIWVV